MIALGEAGAPDLARKFRGVWHRADQLDAQVTGTLDLSSIDLPTLNLDGTLLPDTGDLAHTTLLGRTGDAIDLTIDRARYQSMHRPWIRRIHGDLEGPPPVVSERWRGWGVAIGAWLPRGHETPVDQIIFRSAMLREWSKAIAPEFEWTEQPRTIGGTITIPEPLVATTPFGELRFEWTVLGHMTSGGIDERLLPQIVVDLEEHQPIERTWRSIVVPLMHMLTVFVGAGDNLECLLYRTPAANEATVLHEDGAGTTVYGERLTAGEFEWVTSSWMAKAQTRELPHRFEHLIQADEIQTTFAELIRNWFDLHATYEGPLFDYLGVHMLQAMTIEESFYRVTRSLEVLHAVRDPSPKIPQAEFREIKRKLKAALDGDPHRDFVLSRLSHADKPSLKERLEALLEMCGPRLLNWIPGDRATWIALVVTTRDQMTHAGTDGPLDGAALYEAFHLLDLVMRSIILRELGFSAEQADEWVLRTRAARAILYRI